MNPRQDPANAFLPRLAGFVRFLRLRGVSIGIGAELDCAEALERVVLLDRDAFLEACKVTLAKSPADVARIVEAFELYWSLIIPEAAGETPLAVAATRSPPPDGIPSEGELAPGLRIAVDQAGTVRVGMYSADAPSLGHALSAQDPRRLIAVRAGVRRFRRRVATLPGRRLAPARRGSIDFPATARHSLRQGGEWVEFRFERRKRLRAELVVLWDVSGSMRDHEAGLFALVYFLHRLIRRTRVFAFGTHLQEITSRLEGRTYRRAADSAAEALASSGGGTRIGPCLQEFLDVHGALLRPWTTVVIVSDGWDLGDTAGLARALERLHRRCHLVAWVNPYAGEPGFEPTTAGMRAALPHLDLLLGPADFEARTRLSADAFGVRDPTLRARRWGKAFNAAGR